MQEVNEIQEQNCVGLAVQREARCTNDLLGFSDKNLVILAAKAVELNIGYDPFRNQFREIIAMDFLGEEVNWNPLINNGDAFELGVKLGLEMRGQNSPNQVYIEVKGESKFIQSIDGDACKAMRRAIVLAAAQIGRART